MVRRLLAILAAIALTFAWLPPAGATPAAPVAAQPKWAELTPQQRQTLAPLAAEWDSFPAARRKKWLGIAKRYPAMPPQQQQRVQAQMKSWANLSPEERSTARTNFKRKKSMESPQQRETRRKKWEQYQALSESEKTKLRENATRKKPDLPAKPTYISRPLTQPAPARSARAATK